MEIPEADYDDYLAMVDMMRKAEKENPMPEATQLPAEHLTAQLLVDRIRASVNAKFDLTRDEAINLLETSLKDMASATLLRAAEKMQPWASGDVTDCLREWAKSEEDSIADRMKTTIGPPKQPKV